MMNSWRKTHTSPPNTELQVIAATHPLDLDAHANAWDRLIHACSFAYPTQSYGWLKAFYSHRLGPTEQMCCLLVYQEQRLVGVLPLVGGFRAHGLGRAQHHFRAPVDEYHTVRVDLLARSNQAAILQACFDHLSAISSGPPILRWRKVPVTSPIFAAFQQHPDRLSLLFRQSGLEHRIALPSDFNAFLSTLGSKFRRELFRQERRLQERALVTSRCREGSRSVEDNLARFMAVEHSGWKGKRHSSIQARPGEPPLYLAAAKQFARDGWLEWGFLEADGQDIAAQFAVRMNGVLFLWKVGYQEAFANCAPSHLLFLRTVEHACALGDVTAVNFMARRHWLRVWEPVEHPLYNLIVYPADLAPKPLAKMTQAAQSAHYRLWDGENPSQSSATTSARWKAQPTIKPGHAASSGPDPAYRTDRATVIWAGDSNLGRRQHYQTASIGAENVLGGIAALRTADLRIANLECVVATAGEQGFKGSKKAPYYYRARPDMLRILTGAHIDIVATANNHSGDYGPEALLEQARWLDAVGIGHAGTGPHLEAALQPVLRRAGHLNVALFSLDATQPRFAATQDSPGSAHLDPDLPDLWRETLTPRISAIRDQAHVVLVAVHWGRNHIDTPEPRTRALARAIIDAGADAVLGCSAHWVQGAEIDRQRPILYDAGNLLFDSVRNTLHRGGLFALDISPHGVEQIRFIPIGIGFGYSVQLSGRNARKTIDQFRALSADLGTPVSSDAADTGTIALCPPRRVVKTRLPQAPYTRYDLSVLEPAIASTTAAGAVDQVPQAARIAPVRLGPLTLLGLRIDPQTITHRQLLWVESFWSCEAPISEDIRLNIRGVPLQPTTMPVWGKRMDHDPGDWLAPTSRWQPGVIYRDYYGLRAPRMSQMLNVDLRIEVGILSRLHPDVSPYLGPVLRMAIPELESAPASTTTPSYRSDFPAAIQPCQPGQTWTAAQLQEVTGGTWDVPPPEGWFVRSAAYQRSHLHRLPKPFFFVAHALAQRQRHAQSTRPKRDYDRHDDLPTLAPHCAGAMVSRPVAGVPADFPLLRVADPIQALMELGLAARQRYSGPLVAITGTAGKSTTVAMLQQMLTALSEPTSNLSDPVLATQGNYNTRIDALALLANLHPEHSAAIVEVAQSALWMKRGPVTRLIRPTISVITEIGLSQTDRRVSSVADTAHWKSQIFDGLTDPAVAVIGEHLPYFDKIQSKAAQHAQQLLVVGDSRNAQLRIRAMDSRRSGPMIEHRITLDTPQGRLRVTLPLSSPGMVRNALAALAVLLAMDKDLSAGAEALRHFVPNAGCLRHQAVRLHHGEVTLIDDSYNATVISMLNAFQVLAEATPPARGRKIAVLGRIVHLGDLAQPLHEELAQPLLATGVEQVITHGPEMRFLRAKLPADRLGPHCSRAQEVVRHLDDLAQDGDLILIKGSRRASDFGQILHLLTQSEHRDAEHPASRTPASVFAFTEDLLLQAAARRDLKITRHPAGYVEIAQHGRGAIFRRNSPDHSVLAATITADKRRTRQLLDLNGLPTQNGAVFGNLHSERARHVRVMVLGGRAVGAYESVSITLTGNGRDTVALTETIHASLLTLAERAVHCVPGLHLAGVSLLCEAPERDLAGQRAVILDIDGKPAIADLAFPGSGPALDLSNEVLDYALDLAQQHTPLDQPPCVRPAPAFTPAADRAFALDSRLEVQLLRHAARSRGLIAERLSSKLTRIADADSQCLFYRTMSPGTRIVARRATNTHKSWAKQLLRAAGLPTPNGQTFTADQQAAAWAYLQRQRVPAVIKPQSGSWGRGVTTNVTQREQFDDAWTLAIQTKATSILVEDYIPGALYRLFVIGHTLVAAAEMLPAHVTGDGQQSIQALVDAQNRQREQDPGLAQCPLVLGPSVLRQLQAQGLNPNAIPEAGRTVQLDSVANIGVGGTSQDVTENVHPDFAPLAVKARLAVFDPPHVGIDLVAEDISLPPDKQTWSLIEVNTNPDLSVHHFPTAGQPRDVAGSVIEHLFKGHP